MTCNLTKLGTILLVAAFTLTLLPTIGLAQKGLPPVPKDGSCSAAAAAAKDGINWEPDLKTAMAKAKRLDKPVFIVFLCRFLGDCNSPHA